MAEGDTTKVLIQQELSEHIWPEFKVLHGRCSERGEELSALREVVKQSRKQTDLLATKVDEVDSKFHGLELHITRSLSAANDRSEATAKAVGRKTFWNIVLAVFSIISVLLAGQTAYLNYITTKIGSPIASTRHPGPLPPDMKDAARTIPRTLAP